jgi:hypothetical protein
MGINNYMRLFLLLLSDSFTLLNGELNGKQLMKCSKLKDIDASVSNR